MVKYRVEITKDEAIRYISHLDYAALMQRAICRAHLPAAYSEGFNPHMKIAFASALAVGVTSDAEYMDMELSEPLEPSVIAERLAPQLPAGVRLKQLKAVEGKHAALMAEVDQAVYSVEVPLQGNAEDAAKAVDAFNAAPEVVYHRVTPKKTREIEVKQYMQGKVALHVAEQSVHLLLRIRITSSGSIKPGEILALLCHNFGLPVQESLAVIHRQALLSKGKTPMELI